MKIYHLVDKLGGIYPATYYDRKDAELAMADFSDPSQWEVVEDSEPDPKTTCCNNPNNLFLSQGGLVKK